MKKSVKFAPNGVILSVPAENSDTQDTLFIPLNNEEIKSLRGMENFSLTASRYSGAKILGNQAKSVKVTSVRSHLHQDWDTGEVFTEYREHFFDRANPEHEFLN